MSTTPVTQLRYAPAPKGINQPVIVLASGVITTMLTLLLVYVCDRSADGNIMGWYANYVIPIGAIFVGIAAGAGYGLASWLTGVKIRAWLLATVIVLQIFTYFCANYLQFKIHGPLVLRGTTHILTFPEYYHYEAVNFAWKQDNGKPGEPLGTKGYFFRALEVLGFVLGGIVVPAAMMKVPYCELCQIYMKTRNLATIPASLKLRAPRLNDDAARAEFDRSQKEAYLNAHQQIQSMASQLLTGDTKTFNDTVKAFRPGKRKAAALPVRIKVSLIGCRGCHGGRLATTLLTGQGNNVKKVPLNQTHLPAEVVRALL